MAIMTNSQNGCELCGQVISAIALAYGWPDFHPVERTMIQLPPDALTRFAGTYQAMTPSGFAVTITVENGQLMGQPTRGAKAPLFPESPTKFFLKQAPVEVEFVPNDKGEVTSLIVHQGGQEIKADKKP